MKYTSKGLDINSKVYTQMDEKDLRSDSLFGFPSYAN